MLLNTVLELLLNRGNSYTAIHRQVTVPHYAACTYRFHTAMTREQYLHQGGWPVPHHQQPWVVKVMELFHNKQTKWRQRLCSVCHEVWPARACLQVDLQDCIAPDASETNTTPNSFQWVTTCIQVKCHHV